MKDPIWAREVETASAEARLAAAEAAWDRQQRHLLEHSEFYRQKLRGKPVKLADLGRLPFTTKAELKDALERRPPFGANGCVPDDRVKRVYQTSGTTGTPSILALTAHDEATWSEIGARTYHATGIDERSGVVSTYGAGPFVAGHTYFALNRIGARTVPVGTGDTARTLFAFRAGIADTLLATASFAQYLANTAEVKIGHVVTGGEPGGGIPAIRDHIQERLGAVVNEVMGIGDVSPSLFGECPLQQGMHFCGTGFIWPELVDPDSREPVEIETGAVGELVYTHLDREAMPVVRFLGGDLVRVEGTACECGRTSFRMRCIGRRDDMFIVRGVNVYPTAILALVGEFRPAVTGRARVIREGDAVSVEPPVPIEVEVTEGGAAEADLAKRIEDAVRARLTFRCRVRLVPEAEFGDAGYKTRLTVSR